MRIYKDSQLKEEIKELDFGILEAGESKEYTFYVKNDTDAEVKKLNFSVENKEVSIVKSPEILPKKEFAELKIKWSPSVTLRQGLKAELKISGIELYS
jgi:hypothetical protein